MVYGRRARGWLLLVLLAAGTLLAAPRFPALTGRVVDDAHMLDPARERQLDELLAAHQRATDNQVVVVTLPDLQGYPIETFGYQLGRHWGIGQKGKDNGVLLIVAKAERKVRIEVGYGLEGTLTDAISSNIVHGVILPAFRKGRFGEGIEAGAKAIIAALGGQYQMRKASARRHGSPVAIFIFMGLIGLTFIGQMFAPRSLRYGRGGFIGVPPGGFGGGFGGGGGGGFSGGGGGFGGGGASGGW